MENLPPKRRLNFAIGVIEFLSGLKLAGALILLLGLLTWLGTLEQVDQGLYLVKKKYFSQETFFILPELNGKTVPLPLPNAYWVGMLFFVNLVLGTLLRVRRGWKTVGVLISHFGMLFLLFGAFVTQHYSVRGNMALSEGETSDVAESYFDYVIEVTKLDEGRPEMVHLIDADHLRDLDSSEVRTMQMANLPFDLQVSNYLPNARPLNAARETPEKGERVLDGYYLKKDPKKVDSELNTAGCILTVLSKEGEKGEELLMSARSYYSPTLRWEDQVYQLRIRKKLWKIPFEVRLDDFRHEYHPGTSQPKSFESSVVRLEEGREEPVEIRMNEPMRHHGYTYFQASWGPPGAGPDDELYSVFEVVQNPADKWPEYALWITGFGLFVHFVMMLTRFTSTKPKKDVVKRKA
jgi:hypothetical protein